jgi:ribosomal protein L37E
MSALEIMRSLYEVHMGQRPAENEQQEKAPLSLCPHCDEEFYDEAAGYCEACGYEDE